MFYTIEILPNGKERVGVSTYFVAHDYLSWSNLLKEEISYFYRQDYRVNIQETLTSIFKLVDKDVPSLYEIEMTGATFTCLVTEHLTTNQFQAFAHRQAIDTLIRQDRGLLDDITVFFHWLVYHQFKQKTFIRLFEAFNEFNYSFFEKESTSALKEKIGAMVDEMDALNKLMPSSQVKDDMWFKRMEEIQTKFKPKSNILQWIVPEDMESFQNHRNVIKKDHLLLLVEQQYMNVANL